MHKVFLSYASEDRRIVDEVAKNLASENLQVFSDRRDIAAGERWLSQIEKALADSDTIVTFISPAYLKSEWAQYELGYGVSRVRHGEGVKIIPVIIHNTELPRPLSNLQTINASNMTAAQIAEKINQGIG